MVIVFPGGAPNPRTTTSTTAAEPLTADTTVAGHPIETVQTLPGDPIVSPPVCTPLDPEVSTTEGETTYTEQEVVTPADPGVTEDRESLASRVVETRAPGQPIVTTTVRGTNQTCYNNPSTAEQRKSRC